MNHDSHRIDDHMAFHGDVAIVDCDFCNEELHDDSRMSEDVYYPEDDSVEGWYDKADWINMEERG